MTQPRVGPVVRTRRKELRRTLADVAAGSGLSVPFLSQVENGRAHPSMRSLQRIADALGTTAVALLSAVEEPASVDVVRARENALPDESDGRTRYLVRGSRQLHALEFDGATSHGDRTFVHRDDELLYVVRGTAEVVAAGRTYELGEGDTLYLPGGVEHSWRGLGADTKVLVVAVGSA